MWHNDTFSQRNKATKRAGLGSVGQNLKEKGGGGVRGEGGSNVRGSS